MIRALCLIALLIMASSAWGECRAEHDNIGAGITWTECSSDYQAREDRDRIGAGITHGSDNRGHAWRRQQSPARGNIITYER